MRGCNNCKHITPQGKCKAFPDGIPSIYLITTGLVHDKVVEGQVGDTVYEPRQKQSKDKTFSDIPPARLKKK